MIYLKIYTIVNSRFCSVATVNEKISLRMEVAFMNEHSNESKKAREFHHL